MQPPDDRLRTPRRMMGGCFVFQGCWVKGCPKMLSPRTENLKAHLKNTYGKKSRAGCGRATCSRSADPENNISRLYPVLPRALYRSSLRLDQSIADNGTVYYQSRDLSHTHPHYFNAAAKSHSIKQQPTPVIRDSFCVVVKHHSFTPFLLHYHIYEHTQLT